MSQSKEARAVELLQQPEFIERHIWPMCKEAITISSVEACEIQVEQALGTERVTVEYRLNGDVRLFAKYYTDGDLGLSAYNVLRTLWMTGFDMTSPYRVPEPIGYSAEHRILLMKAAQGERLSRLLERSEEQWEEGLRGAAQWLAVLHNSSVRSGVPEDWGRGLFRVAHRLVKAAARHPEMEKLLERLVKDLATQAPNTANRNPQVQTHGRYHAGHIFLIPGHVTVIDLDRSCPADPAKDVAEFLHRLRSDAGKGKADEQLVNQAMEWFLEEYISHASVDLSGLAYYWSYSVMSTLLHTIRKRHLDLDAWEQRLEFYQSEFYSIPKRVKAWQVKT